MDALSLQETKKSLILDHYNDVFSSFDPREYNERALSDDFLEECKHIVMDKTTWIKELNILVPITSRDPKSEDIIKKRLHSYFIMQSHYNERQIKKDLKIWWYFVVLGVLISLSLSYVLHYYNEFNFVITMVTVVGEPASWFMVWTWGDKIMQYFSREKWKYQFYKNMSHAKIQFWGYTP